MISAIAFAGLFGQYWATTKDSLVQAVYATEPRSVDPLLKPPLMEDPRQALIQSVVRSTYPELFSSTATPGWVAITLLMKRDGTLYTSYKDNLQSHPYYTNTLKVFDALGVDYEHRGDRVQLAMKGGSAGATGISVRAFFLNPPSDPTRDVALVRASVNARYGAYYSPLFAERVTQLTVLMTESGSIKRVRVQSVNAIGADVAPTAQNFVEMGVPRQRIGSIGKVMLYEGSYESGLKSKRLLVVYAWPRRVNEPAPQQWHAEQSGPMAPNDDPDVNRAIAEKYFPDLYTYNKPDNELNADFWVLLDHDGHVRATGRQYLASLGDLKFYLESLYPGIRTEGFEPVEFKGNHGRQGVVNFTWLAANSPVTDLSKADLSRRADVVLYAEICGDGITTMTNLITFKFNVPVIAVDDRKDLDLQVIGSDAGADTVMLRARIQRVPHASPAEFQWGTPAAVEANWSAEAPPVRVRYGEFFEMQMIDQDHKTWKVSLHPDHMRGEIH